jgi:hypothetical protein
MRAKTLIVTVMLAFAPAAEARHSHDRIGTGFATGSCVSSNCFGRHPGGTWRHPLSEPTGRARRPRGFNYPGV